MGGGGESRPGRDFDDGKAGFAQKAPGQRQAPTADFDAGAAAEFGREAAVERTARNADGLGELRGAEGVGKMLADAP